MRLLTIITTLLLMVTLPILECSTVNVPGAPHSLAAIGQDSTSVKLSWTAAPPKDGVGSMAFAVHYAPTTGVDEELQKVVLQPFAEILFLRHSTNYSFYVTAYNKFGASTQSNTIYHGTDSLDSPDRKYYGTHGRQRTRDRHWHEPSSEDDSDDDDDWENHSDSHDDDDNDDDYYDSNDDLDDFEDDDEDDDDEHRLMRGRTAGLGLWLRRKPSYTNDGPRQSMRKKRHTRETREGHHHGRNHRDRGRNRERHRYRLNRHDTGVDGEFPAIRVVGYGDDSDFAHPPELIREHRKQLGRNGRFVGARRLSRRYGDTSLLEGVRMGNRQGGVGRALVQDERRRMHRNRQLAYQPLPEDISADGLTAYQPLQGNIELIGHDEPRDDVISIKKRGLPDMTGLGEWMQGNLRVGPKIDINWNLGDLILGSNRGEERWWNGPNVCSFESEEDSDDDEERDGDCRTLGRHLIASVTKCDDTDTTYKCTTTLTLGGRKRSFSKTYECCYGYKREEGEQGCTQELVLTDLLTTLTSLNLTQLREALESVGFDNLLSEGNYTIFAPTDEAFEEAFPQMDAVDNGDFNIVRVSPDDMNMAVVLENTLTSHITEGFLKSSSLEDEMMLSTANADTRIRINKFEIPKRVVTANCQPLQTIDNQATNGVIHTVPKILTPVEYTMFDIISQNSQLKTLKNLLVKTGLDRELDKTTGDFTLFAPKDSAFSNLNTDKFDKLLSSDTCLKNVLLHHLLPHVICSSVISGGVKTFNRLRNFLHFNRTISDEVYVEQAQVTGEDIMATNGVIHVIDDVLIPEEALDVLDVAEKAGANLFLDLVEKAGLSKTLRTSDNITVFVPSNKAIELLPPDVVSDPEVLAKVLKYHIVPHEVTGQRLRNGMELETLDSVKKIRCKGYSSFPFSMKNIKTVQCAPIRTPDLETCNGVIHIVDKVLMPPQGDVLDVLQLNSKFSTLVGLLKIAGIADQLQMSGPFTVFAPTNEAFAKLDSDVISKLNSESERENLKKILLHHIMYGTLCCSGVIRTPWLMSPREQMLDGSSLLISRGDNDDITVNSVNIESCDLSGSNGIVHAIEDILPEAVNKYTGIRLNSERRNRFTTIMSDFSDGVDRFNKRVSRFDWEFEWPELIK